MWPGGPRRGGGAGETVGGAPPWRPAHAARRGAAEWDDYHGRSQGSWSKGPWVAKGGYESSSSCWRRCSQSPTRPWWLLLDEALGIAAQGFAGHRAVAVGVIGSSVALELAGEPQSGEDAALGRGGLRADRRGDEQQAPGGGEPIGRGRGRVQRRPAGPRLDATHLERKTLWGADTLAWPLAACRI